MGVVEIYLEPEEYEIYCSEPDVTDFDIEFASCCIDAYIGKSIGAFEKTETVNLNKKNQGRLTKTPILEITNIEAIYHNIFGLSMEQIPLDGIYLDDYGLFTYCFHASGRGYNQMIFGCSPKKLRITYTYGYKEIPKDIKIVCGIIASNYVRNKSMGGFSGAKQISSLDFNVVLFDDKIMSSNEISILNRYKDL